jgi:dihydroorotase
VKEGGPADLTVLDLDELRVVDKGDWMSKGWNCPWQGTLLQGWPVMTIIEGRIFQGRL